MWSKMRCTTDGSSASRVVVMAGSPLLWPARAGGFPSRWRHERGRRRRPRRRVACPPGEPCEPLLELLGEARVPHDLGLEQQAVVEIVREAAQQRGPVGADA